LRADPGTYRHLAAKDSMSDSISDEGTIHEGPIKTPRQLVVAVAFAFVVPVIVIILLASYVSNDTRPAAGSNLLDREAVAARLAPVGQVTIRSAADASTLKTGEQVFAAQCTACHTAGVLGAPKVGDVVAWAPRIKTGYAALLNSALKGKNAMPPQGMGAFGEIEIGRALVYMANQAGAKFDEPKAPPAAASAPASAASR
jgi:cytochrome c5